MSIPKNNTVNLAEFTPRGRLGALFAQARVHNQVNARLKKILPSTLGSLELCLIKDTTATLVANDQSVVFRAQKQQALLLKILNNIEGLEHIRKIVAKVYY